MATFIIVCEEEERALHRERVFRDRSQILDTLSDDVLVARYRMPRHALFMLINKVQPHIMPDTKRSHALSPETKVLTTLRFLGKGEFFVELGDLNGISKSSVSRLLRPTIQGICDALNNISIDQTRGSIIRTKSDFFKLAGFPKVIGAIDGTLIPIAKPPADEEAAFVCRKGFHAINVQAVCDASLGFTNDVARWPGSAHNSSILNNSIIGQTFQHDCPDGFLLGDSGYGCRPWLLTPLADPSTPAQQRYQLAHCKTRNVVERAFGVLKSRFRCLHKSTGYLPFSTKKCCKEILACFYLHNFCIDLRLPQPEPMEEDNTDDPYQGAVNDGHQVRQHLIDYFFTA
ncbi:putative nuclease HARBI1 [Haliotis rubra]|uniref:putative nuclease HARBI1 n=1 Tax=Haliotis rubra TaxID=36100 RepID=UPI001EE53F4F|nr:putative nuclease HARBI1 [Haliotis rubra]